MRALRAFLWLAGAVAVSAQTFPTISFPTIQTTGGLSYLTFQYDATCPTEVWKRGAPTVSGTNVNVTLLFIDNPSLICVPVFPPLVTTRRATMVLGALQPGTYTCNIVLASYDILFGWVRVDFTVEPTLSTMSLLPSASGRVRFQINGVTNVTYTVESSSSLTNWTTLQTLRPGVSLDIAPATNTFWRIRINDTVPNYTGVIFP